MVHLAQPSRQNTSTQFQVRNQSRSPTDRPHRLTMDYPESVPHYVYVES
jgi:hypothetical protein